MTCTVCDEPATVDMTVVDLLVLDTIQLPYCDEHAAVIAVDLCKTCGDSVEVEIRGIETT